ncbi:MAG: nucleotidyltransferase domain-containing protein [Bdellovibrio sp.]|nr:MAG: nucleotidyltransferase domain-containing protein [Bdellovibrio sp.]
MRLNHKEINAIKTCLKEIDPHAEVYLFGSRTDDHAKGGDIDLIIISEKMGLEEKLRFQGAVKQQIGDQKIDVILTTQESSQKDPFISHQLSKACKL